MFVDKNFVLLSLGSGLMFFCLLSWFFTSVYGLPFGMSDVDRYLCMWGVRDIGDGCFPATSYTFWTHFFTFGLSWFDSVTINFVILFCVWVCLPLVVYLFSCEFLDMGFSAVYSVFYFMFGTYVVFFFVFMGLWAQLSSFLFFVLSLRFFEGGRFWFGLFVSCFAILAHPYVLSVYFLFVLSYGIFRKDLKFIGVCLCLFLFGWWFSGFSLLRFTIFGAPNFQSGFFNLFFIFCNPLLVMFGLLGLLNARSSHNKSFTLMLLVLAPFSLDTRLFPYLLLFLVNYGYIGLRHCMKSVKNGRFLEFFLVLSFYVQFSYLLDYFMKLLIVELPLRGLDPFVFAQYFI